jgi:hypothetical protein
MGYATTDMNSNYRYFIVSGTAAYTVTIVPKIGEPTLLVKIASEIAFKPSLDSVQSYDFKTTSTKVVDQDMREDYEFACRND